MSQSGESFQLTAVLFLRPCPFGYSFSPVDSLEVVSDDRNYKAVDCISSFAGDQL